MLLTHLIVFSHNKSVAVFLSLYGQKPSIPNFGLQRKRKKMKFYLSVLLIVVKGTLATRHAAIETLSKHLRRSGGGGDGRAGVG